MPRAESDRLRLLKRAWTVSRQAGDFSLLSEIAERALSADRGSRGVRQVAGYAYLRTGRAADAGKVLEGALPAGTGDLLRGETALRLGTPWKGSDALTREILGLEGSRNPADFEAAAQRTGVKDLAADAALLSMEAGNTLRAAIIARSALQEAVFDEPAGLMAYDSGDFEEAITRLSRLQAQRTARADIALILADCYQALGRKDEAETSLQASLRLNPRQSWTPYASLAAFAAARGDLAGAREMLDRGHALFPASAELVMERADLEAGQGNVEAAVSMLDRLVESRPEDSAAALFRLKLKAPRLSPEAYRAELWKLFDRIPADRAAFTALVGSLVVAHDWDDAMLAMRQHRAAAADEDPFRLLMSGVVDAMRGSTAESVGFLRAAADASRDGAARYDLALVLLNQGLPAEALDQLAEAAAEARGLGGATSFRLLARIETLTGRALLVTGDFAGARSAFLRARALDPHDLRIGLELRKLEAGADQ